MVWVRSTEDSVALYAAEVNVWEVRQISNANMPDLSMGTNQ